MTRYKVVEGSQSCHCCFEFTVVDTTKPEIIGGKPWAPGGIQQYDAVCETWDREAAEHIATALNENPIHG